MAITPPITLFGDKRLENNLKKLGTQIERNFRRNAANQTMRVLRTKARKEAPDIRSKHDKREQRRGAIVTKVSAKKGRPIEGKLFVNYRGKGKQAFWAHFFEFGTKRRTVSTGPYAGRSVGRIRAYHFMTRTYEKYRHHAVKYYQRVLKQQVEHYARTKVPKMKFTGGGKDFDSGSFVSKG